MMYIHMKKFKEKHLGKDKQFWMLLILILISFCQVQCKKLIRDSKPNIITNLIQNDTVLSYNTTIR